MMKNNLRRKGFISSSNSQVTLHDNGTVRTGSQVSILEVGTGGEAMKECYLVACFS